ncbi:hypothetical protein AVEN_165141-1 [Araneus ventricosus]|uniref:Integrase catalytic domain-containing protein n=1 Tax=Araneus ventricosus TaxID=182803 RepID=A0A4Y2B676_ARAVE|nr:hypothetical protein AVEN_165141-1 [Araneus ventricosus]
MAAISVPESVDYDEMATAQDSDDELRSLLETGSGLELKQLILPSLERLLYSDISTDRGSNFVSNLFQDLTRFLSTSKTRTTSFLPAASGIVERMHRQLKASIKCYATLNWSEVLPTVLLGMRVCLKEDIGVSPAEMVYGQCLSLPGEFFRNSTSPR